MKIVVPSTLDKNSFGTIMVLERNSLLTEVDLCIILDKMVTCGAPTKVLVTRRRRYGPLFLKILLPHRSKFIIFTGNVRTNSYRLCLIKSWVLAASFRYNPA